MSTEPQSYANHKRIDPWYHQAGFALLLLVLILVVTRLVRGHGGWTQLLIVLLLALTFTRLRIYALRVQDRIIRLEETLRMERLLDPGLRARIPELRPGQFVALRFASDAELPARMEEALRESLPGGEIKKRIQSWRADTFRV